MARRQLFSDSDDDAWGTGKAKPPDIDLDITPMIDVTFLLLIFFMVTSTMQAKPDQDLPVARYGAGVEAKQATLILIRQAGREPGAKPSILIDGEPGSPEDARRKVEAGLRAQRVDVIIKADREVPHGVVQSVTKAIAGVEGIKLSVGVLDKPVGARE